MNITKKFALSVVITLLCVISAGCEKAVTETNSSQLLQPMIQTACMVALSPHAGTEKSDKSIQQFQTALSDNSLDAKQLENLGWAYINKAQESFDPGFYKLAEQTVECMNRQQADTLATLLMQGHIFQNLHKFKQAELIARQLVQKRAYWYDYGLLGDALMEQGELSLATAAYQQMMDQNPGPQAYNRAAYMRWLTGDVDGAIELLKLSMSAYAGQNSISSAWTLTRIADYELQSGQIVSASKHINAVLAKQPGYAPALLVQSRIKMALGLKAQAIAVLTRALELNPLPEYKWELIEAIAGIEILQNKRAEVERQLMQTGETEDRRTFALYLASTGIDPEKALTLAKQETAIRQDVFTLDTLAWALRANNQLDAADKYSKQALKAGTRSARLYYHAGVIASERGDTTEATRLLQLAKKLEINLLPSERKHLNQML